MNLVLNVGQPDSDWIRDNLTVGTTLKVTRPMSREEFLLTMLTSEQRTQLERVQQALAADPTCLETSKMDKTGFITGMGDD